MPIEVCACVCVVLTVHRISLCGICCLLNLRIIAALRKLILEGGTCTESCHSYAVVFLHKTVSLLLSHAGHHYGTYMLSLVHAQVNVIDAERSSVYLQSQGHRGLHIIWELHSTSRSVNVAVVLDPAIVRGSVRNGVEEDG